MTTHDSDTPRDAFASPDSPASRWAVLHDLEDWLEKPILALSVGWLALLVIELTRGLSPALEVAGTVIWVIFIADFMLRLWLSPDRSRYVRRNWLTVLSLVVPALRLIRILAVVRVARAARTARALHGVTRGARVVRVVGSINRGMAALRRSMARRGLGFVLLLTAVVVLAGAAGMYAFERDLTGEREFDSFWTALWWTAMLITTMGSDYWPQSAEGRVLCIMLAMYAFAVFGYVTASLATFFIGRDADDPNAEVAGATAIEALRADIASLRQEMLRGRARSGDEASGT